MRNNDTATELKNTVIDNGYCVGCGACAVPEGSPFSVARNDYGQFQAQIVKDRVFATSNATAFNELCPFGSKAPSEDQLARDRFAEACQHNEQVGYYKGSYAGHVAEGTFRQSGSSGGMGTWILSELLRQEKIDHIINVQPCSGTGDNPSLFTFSIGSSVEEILSGSKSRYYPVELSDVMDKVRSTPGRYAIVGLPCFIKSVRLLQRQDPILNERISYCVGLVCGHLKSTGYAQSLAWQTGINPGRLKAIDFRVKNPQAPANRYDTLVAGDREQHVVPTNELFGTDWGAGAFKYKACDFCDDVFAETADVVLGDAWLPQYVEDSNGTNILVTRNTDIHSIISEAREQKRLALDDLPIEQAIASQDAGLRHRKGAIGYRLYRQKAEGLWVPPKRISPSANLWPRYERKRQDLRMTLRELSHSSFQKALAANDLNIYLEQMQPVYRKYKSIKGSLRDRLVAFAKRLFRAVRRRLPGTGKA